MRLLCITDYTRISDGSQPGIIVGRYYEVIDQDTIGYKVIDEFGRRLYYIKSCFEPIEVTRDRKINKLLDEYRRNN